MKEMSPAPWLYWFGLFAIACMLLPVILVLAKRQFSAGFLALSFYFISIFVYNLLLLVFPEFPVGIKRGLGVTCNMLDAPLMLLFLLQFTVSDSVRKLMKVSLVAFILFEVVVVFLYGFTVKSITIFSGPGLLLILFFSFYFFTRLVRSAIIQKMDIAKTMMISGVLFAYGIYFMLYLFYYVLETPNKTDSLLIYFLASSVASLLLSTGLMREKKGSFKKIINEPRKFAILL
jgi:hypothetical protein